MSKILVTSLAALDEAVAVHCPSHVLTLLSPAYMIEPLRSVPAERHKRIPIDDITQASAGAILPDNRHIEDILEFGRGWNGSAPMVVHCFAGVSRSTAAAFLLLCDRFGPDSETAIAEAMRRRGPHVLPNALMVRLADALMERRGKMIEAISRIGQPTSAETGIVELPLVFQDL